MKVAIDPLHNRRCPSRAILDVVGGKWALLLVCVLRDGPARTGELKRAVDGISQKMLTQTLRELERNGVIARTSYPQVPPRVDYRLTPVGMRLGALVSEIEDWVLGNFADVIAAQKHYDAQTSAAPHVRA
jgi:DNA-binding HxlR family transcriptional regulator